MEVECHEFLVAVAGPVVLEAVAEPVVLEAVADWQRSVVLLPAEEPKPSATAWCFR